MFLWFSYDFPMIFPEGPKDPPESLRELQRASIESPESVDFFTGEMSLRHPRQDWHDEGEPLKEWSSLRVRGRCKQNRVYPRDTQEQLPEWCCYNHGRPTRYLLCEICDRGFCSLRHHCYYCNHEADSSDITWLRPGAQIAILILEKISASASDRGVWSWMNMWSRNQAESA